MQRVAAAQRDQCHDPLRIKYHCLQPGVALSQMYQQLQMLVYWTGLVVVAAAAGQIAVTRTAADSVEFVGAVATVGQNAHPRPIRTGRLSLGILAGDED